MTTDEGEKGAAGSLQEIHVECLHQEKPEQQL